MVLRMLVPPKGGPALYIERWEIVIYKMSNDNDREKIIKGKLKKNILQVMKEGFACVLRGHATMQSGKPKGGIYRKLAPFSPS